MIVGMSPTALYPARSSEYTNPADGKSYEVPCYNPQSRGTLSAEIECPDPFVPRTKDGTSRTCVQVWTSCDTSFINAACFRVLFLFINCVDFFQPCPAAVYSDDEYTTMWRIYIVFSLIGFVLSVIMALTWSLASTRERQGIKSQLRFGVWLGILYGVVRIGGERVKRVSSWCCSCSPFLFRFIRWMRFLYQPGSMTFRVVVKPKNGEPPLSIHRLSCDSKATFSLSCHVP